MFTPPKQDQPPKQLDLPQIKYPRGVITVLADSSLPLDGLADCTNAQLVQDARPAPRPSLIDYGDAAVGDDYIGAGTFTKIVDGLPERWEIAMQVISGVGKITIRKDGGAWTTIGGTYDDTAWAQFCQSNNRVYVSNGVDNMSYYDIDTGSIITASALDTPSAPSIVRTGLSGTNYTYYYKISANNAFGETAASTSTSQQVSALRDSWDSTSNYLTISWSAVTGATSYNIYVADTAGNECFLATVNGLDFKDDGTVAINTFRIFPSGNSTTGPTLTYLYNSNSQLFGVGDINNPSYLWYSATGANSGDFSPFNGGGYVGINYGGDTVPTNVRVFRTGKGDPALTVLSRGGGYGKLHHVVFDTTTVGDTPIISPTVSEANGQDGTVSPFGVVEANNSLYYPTGDAFKSTGTKPSVINVLSTDDVSEPIQPSVQNLNKSVLEKCCGLYHRGRIFWSVATGSNEQNNQIWVLDLSRKGLWILRWTVSVRYMWLYQDNSGTVHHLALTYDNRIMEFSDTVSTTDADGAFKVRIASGAINFDESGQSMASIEKLRFKFLYPKGQIKINVYGLAEDGPVSLLANETYDVTPTNTGWGQMLWSNPDDTFNGPSMYSGDIGVVDLFSTAVAVVPVEIDDILNQYIWEVITENTNCGFILASVRPTGSVVPGLYYGD